MHGGDRVRRDHEFHLLDLPRGLHLPQMPGDIRRELLVLKQLHCLEADPVQQVDPAVDGREVHVEGAREPLLADALVDCAWLRETSECLALAC